MWMSEDWGRVWMKQMYGEVECRQIQVDEVRMCMDEYELECANE